MRLFLRYGFFFFLVSGLVGVTFVTSMTKGDETKFHDPLGDLAVPEGFDLVNQLPDNLLKDASLPKVEKQRLLNENTNTGSDVAATSSNTNKKIIIRLNSQTLEMIEGETNLGSYKISSGRRGMETPTGNFSILSKTPRAYSKTYGLYMPYWMAFTTRGHGIHELPEWPGGLKEGENHLGTPVSHGCVRLGVGPAKILYEWAEIGTPVLIIR